MLSGRVLVLGASGFLGRHVCAALAAAGYEVVAVGRSRIDLVYGPPAALPALLARERPEAVVNAAGAVWDGDAALMRRLNLEVPRRLLAALNAGSRPAHLVQLGSSAEYGRTPPWRAIVEDVPARPVGSYARSKAAATRELMAGSGPVTVLRIFNAIGPGQPAASLLGGVAAAAAAGVRELAVGPLRGSRDFVDVRDAAEAVVRAVTAGPLHRVVNVGAGVARPVAEVVRRLVRITGGALRLTEHADTGVPVRSGDITWQQADLTAANRLLDWRPRRDIETTLRDLWDHARGGEAGSSGCPAPTLSVVPTRRP